MERSKRRPGAERAYVLAQRIGRAQSLLAVTCIAFQAVSENLGAIGFYLRLGYSVEGCRRRNAPVMGRPCHRKILALLDSAVWNYGRAGRPGGRPVLVHHGLISNTGDARRSVPTCLGKRRPAFCAKGPL